MLSARTLVGFNDYGKSLGRCATPTRRRSPSESSFSPGMSGEKLPPALKENPAPGSKSPGLGSSPAKRSPADAKRDSRLSSRLSPNRSNARAPEGRRPAAPEDRPGQPARASPGGSLAQRLAKPEPRDRRLPWDARRADAAAPAQDGGGARASSPAAALEVSAACASCFDGRHSAAMAFGEATVREERAFWSTTGMYPQSAFVNLEAATRLLELDLVCCPDVLTVSVAVHAADGTWEDVATVTFDDAGRPQSDVRRKLSFANKNVVCSKIKLSIDRSAADFSIVKSVRLLGVPACA